ncbi:PilZ domain-containing protein [Haliangium sp.]|uniref:PilZ domain-containing protein n=1 Tax=Haliangium sp. TaxID=2663208 RepID=UPI003D151C89
MTRPNKPPPPPRSGAERRRHPRYEVLAQVEIRGSEATLVVPILNISLGGAYVELESDEPDAIAAALNPGAGASVFLDAGGDDGDLSMVVDAEILRIALPTGGRGGMALHWELEDEREQAQLERIIAALREKTPRRHEPG